jgi:PRA1 family protein
LLYPAVAQVTPTNTTSNNNNIDDSFYQDDNDESEEKQEAYNFYERTNRMSSSSVQIANGSSDNGSSSSSSNRTKNHRQYQQQQQPIYVDIETMRMQLSSLFTKFQSRISIDTVRPLHVFLGLNQNAGYCLSPTAFTPPVKLSTNKLVDKSTPEKIKSRVQLNFAYFISNYALLAVMTAVVIALMHPGMVLFVGIVYLLWMGHEFLIRHPLIVFGVEVHTLLSIKQRFYFLFTMTSFVVIWKCLAPTIFFLSISSFLIITHSLLRDPKDVEASGSSSFGVDRYNNKNDDDVDIEGGSGEDDDHHHDSGITTSLIDRNAVKSPGAEKRRNAVSNGNSTSDLLLSKQ